jgi:MoaA/NifB/PqqE/SkfB family radical SAM enzyme
MPRAVLELTNRCDLRCAHCFAERHAATGDLGMTVVERVIAEGKDCGIDHLCFNGGEPTLHRAFSAIVEKAAGAGYGFSFVTNGRSFPRVASIIERHRERFLGVTFSLDGAREATHDRSRGAGSFRRVMRAASVCFFRKLPFTLNMVLTTDNRAEVDEMVDLAARLGSQGVRFGHLMFTGDHAARGLVLTPEERREVERRIRALERDAPVFVDIAAGHYSDSPFFPCAPLVLDEYNIDYRGNLTLCCQLSGLSGPNAADDILGNLHDMTLREACARFRARVAVYLADKRDRVASGAFTALDHFPCWYCVNYLGKITAADRAAATAWSPGAAQGRRLHVLVPSRAPRSGCR